MKVDSNTKRRTFTGEDGETLTVRYSNMGEPFRQGVELDFEDQGAFPSNFVRVFLDQREGRELRDMLNELFPRGAQP